MFLEIGVRKISENSQENIQGDVQCFDDMMHGWKLNNQMHDGNKIFENKHYLYP